MSQTAIKPFPHRLPERQLVRSSVSSRNTASRRSSLRDYGAFRATKTDVATLPTQHLQAVIVPIAQVTKGTSPVFDWEETSLSVPTVPLPMPGMVQVRDTPAALKAVYIPAKAEQPRRTDGRKRWLLLLGRVAMTALLFFLLARTLSWGTLVQALRTVQHAQLFVGLCIGSLGIVVSSYQWRSLLRAERIQCDLAALVDLYLVGIAFSHFLPTGMGGDTVKALYVGRDSGNGAGATSAVLMSRVTGFFGMVLLALPVVIIWHAHVQSTVLLGLGGLSLVVGAMLASAIACALLLPLFTRSIPLLQTKRVAKMLDRVTQVGRAMYVTLKRPRFLAKATLIGLQFWVISCLNYYSYAIALDIHVPFYFYCIAIPFVSLVTFLPISINGFGVRESAFVYIFSTMHVPASTALLLALLMDAQVLFFGIVGGLLYLKMGKTKHEVS